MAPPLPGPVDRARAASLQLASRGVPVPGRPRGRSLPVTGPALGAILLIAGFLRLWHIDHVGVNSDEAVYAGQGASIAGREDFEELFPIFRAHPLLFQSLVSAGYRLGADVTVARGMSALLGVATVYATFRLGRLLYGDAAGLVAALLLSVMAYHVVVTRQVLLDGPMVLLTTSTLLMLAHFAASGKVRWLYASAALLGMAVLTKETSILLLGAIYMFFALAPEVRLPMRAAAIAGGLLVVLVVQYPLVLRLAGTTQTGGHYLVWQLFRRPNHTWTFYGEVVPAAIGLAVLIAAAAGLIALRARHGWRETLLLSWIVVPILFFELWPVKGYSYMLPIAPAIAVLAGRTVAWWPTAVPWDRVRHLPPSVTVAVPAIGIALTLVGTTWHRIAPTSSTVLLAGAGGLPGGREAGRWLSGHVPPGAQLMTIGPSMANILAFYGHRRSFGLSVSPNPLTRNPSYLPLINPDRAIREGRVQYAVWDAYSASRSAFFARELLRYVERYRGRVVHQEARTVRTALGRTAQRPLIVVYVLRG
jgi:4-amino-4-deoxy-L-arabinose transferase-like glycosyltransferase